MVRSAVSYALSRNIDIKELKAVDESSILVDVKDFERALSEVLNGVNIIEISLIQDSFE